jgi:uracil-DNA glycosylase
MISFRNQLHPSWANALQDLLPSLDEIEEKLLSTDFLPIHQNVMRALTQDLALSKVLVVGQDPYPNPEYAMGLAFSVPKTVNKLPPTLRNIFKELDADLGLDQPTTGDLTFWHEQGVVLLNRTLTCASGESNSHINLGWRAITDRCAKVLSDQGVVAMLWGSNAAELSSSFSSDKLITSVHPSPLSAYRGFFGSKPFSRVNQILAREGKTPITWI